MVDPGIGTNVDTDGCRHRLVLRRIGEGDWRVLDIDVKSDTAPVVDTLAGETAVRRPRRSPATT